MAVLRAKYHVTTSIKYKKQFFRWLWLAREIICERFERAVGLQKNLRRYLVHKHYKALQIASICFQRFMRGNLGRKKAAIRREMILGTWPKVEIVYERVRKIRNAQGPMRLKILKCGLNYMIEGFDYQLCLSYRGFLPQERIEELCDLYPYGVTGSYSLRKRIRLRPYHVDEMCALLISKMALVEPIKGLGEMEERSRAGHGVLVLVVDPLNGKTPEGLDGPGFQGIQSTFVEKNILIERREDISKGPWVSQAPSPIPLPPEEWNQGAKNAEIIWHWWKETLWMWKTMVTSDIPNQVRASHRLLLRRQGDVGECKKNIIGCFQLFDVEKTGYLAANVLETALYWLGSLESKDKKLLKEFLQEALYYVDETETATKYQNFARSRATEISQGVTITPGLKFGYIDYNDFVNRCDNKGRSFHPKKSIMRGYMQEYSNKLRDKGSLLAETVR